MKNKIHQFVGFRFAMIEGREGAVPAHRAEKAINRRMKRTAVVLCLIAILANSAFAAVVDYLPISLEQAANPAGPWNTVPVRAPQLTTDGKLLLPAVREQEYWRLKVTPAGDIGFALGLLLINVPPAALKTARDFLALHTGDAAVGDPVGDPTGVGDPFHKWRRARLADTVIPVFDAAIDGARTPAYLEFKVIAEEPAPAPGSFRSTDGALRPDQGFILVSLTENDLPVADWFSEGETRIEKLRRRAGTALIKPVMFGSALLVAEDPKGNVRATDGTLFSRPSPELLAHADYVASGFIDTQTGESNRTPELRLDAPLQPYASYAEMKADYETNAFFQIPRDRLREEARLHWLIEKGTLPAEFRVQAGETMTILAGHDVREARLDSPEDASVIARLIPLGRLGLRIDGLAQGSGVLRVQADGREELYTLLVTPKGGGFVAATAFTPGWRLAVKHYKAGTDADQRRYSQYQSLEFGGGGPGNFVGCGPCAWTMLMGWWDLKGVPAAYRPFKAGSGIPNFLLGLPDAPDENTYAVEDMMRDFRNVWVDPVICNPFSGQCATLPSEMGDGMNYFNTLRLVYKNAYLPFFQQNVLGYSYSYKYTYAPKNGVNEFNTLVRDSLHDGFPSIIGVGPLSHYALAYEYIESRYEAAPGYFPFWRAWLRLNWGNGDCKAVKFTDLSFFATKAKLWQTHTEFDAP